MGTTFGGGPMACAVAEAVIDTIESESLLANVRQVSTYIRSSCIIGPGHRHQGAGFLLGIEDLASRQGSAGGAAGRRIFSPAPAAIRTCCACCRPTF
jgi:acetylornithine/N-succinyldiaminopimelate aminotransferase